MSATLQDVLMSLGDWELPLTWDPEIAAELVDGRHLLLYWGQEHIYTGVLLRQRPSRDGIVIGGRSQEWWLGVDDDGPVIEDREYIAGNNKLSNPGFELGGPDPSPLYWEVDEASDWLARANPGEPAEGVWCMGHMADYGKDDVLKSSEVFEAKAGNGYVLSAKVKRLFGDVGRLRLRGVFGGSFTPANRVPDPSFEAGGPDWNLSDGITVVDDGAHALTGTHVMKVGPIAQRQYILNPGFEDGVQADGTTPNDWYGQTVNFNRDIAQPDVNKYPHSGDYMAGFLPIGVDENYYSYGWAQGDCDAGLAGGPNPVYVVPGERYLLAGYIREFAGTVGQASLTLVLIKSTWPAPGGTDFANTVAVEGTNFQFAGSEGEWKYVQLDWTVPGSADPTIVAILPQLSAYFIETSDGAFQFDDVTLTRTVGNVEEAVLQIGQVIGEKSYKFEASVRSDPNITGAMWLRVRFSAAGRPTVVQDLPVQEPTDGEWHRVSQSVTPLSGYDTATISVVGKDITGGSFWVDSVSFAIEDKTEVIQEVKGPEHADDWTTLTRSLTAPASTTDLDVRIAAEALADGWLLDDVSLTRVGTKATTASVVRDLLKDPDTDLPLLAAGDITGPEFVQFDWHIRNLTNRAALQHLSRAGVALPVREWRVNPDHTLDWGTAEELYEDHTDIVFVDEDIFVVDSPVVDGSDEDRLTRVKIIGAERRRRDGRRVVITGEATNLPGDMVDWTGNALRRSRIVEDSTVDHKAYANSLARYDADRAASTTQGIHLGLADWRALGKFKVGDWVYIYKPQAGLVDPDNQMSIAGHTVWPKKLRVLSSTLHLGPGFRAEIRRSDGTTVKITDAVQWDAATTAELEVGDLLPEFVTDPQGGSAGRQFRRFRASTPD